jgi:branched-chain amino acid transport system substrate-binding protein
MKLTVKILAGAAMLAAAGASFAQAGETVKMVRIDPLTGLLGPVGVSQFKGYQFFAEKFSGKGNPAGVKFEITAIDNKLSPAESLNALKAAIDQGARYIIQGNGSSVALALADAVEKHNARNPGKEVMYLNDSAVDPDLTNSKCSYWHFRFDADTSMKMEAMSSFIATQPDIKKIYLLNQNYSHGHQVVKYAKETIGRKRPVITGNWGSDLSLLIKAANENGYNGKFFTYYAGVTGTPTALGTNGAGRVYQIAYNHYNMGGQMEKWMKEFNQKYNDDFYTGSTIRIYEMLGAAMAKAKSTDPVKVAAAMEGLTVKSFNGEVQMRKNDHQLQQPLYMSVWQKADAKYPYSPEKTGMTLAPVAEYPNYVSSTPTSCQMKRPS